MIYLNESNAEKLNAQLEQQHHINLKEFQTPNADKSVLKRYDRSAYLKLPHVQFYQLKINYETLTLEDAKPNVEIPKAATGTDISHSTKTQDFLGNTLNIKVDDTERGDIYAAFTPWLYSIARASFGFITMEQLNAQTDVLRGVFDTITYERNGERYFSSRYDRALIEANIRKAFYDKRGYTTSEELIPQTAKLLNIANFTDTIHTNSPSDYFPVQPVVENIVLADKGKLKIPKKELNFIQSAIDSGHPEFAETIRQKYNSHPAKDRSFHYLPYKTDSGFEQEFLGTILGLDDVERLGLEVYYNGDRALTEFKIRCYKNGSGRWQYIGMYTPDFLIIRRKDGQIHKAVIVETKGKIYANDPTFKDKRSFMETEFTTQNNKAFGYSRFEYLYLEDALPEKERIILTHQAIQRFFKEA